MLAAAARMGDVDKDMAEEGLHTHPPVSVNCHGQHCLVFIRERVCDNSARLRWRDRERTAAVSAVIWLDV